MLKTEDPAVPPLLASGRGKVREINWDVNVEDLRDEEVRDSAGEPDS